jgi:hypothetical protein
MPEENVRPQNYEARTIKGQTDERNFIHTQSLCKEPKPSNGWHGNNPSVLSLVGAV